MSKYLIAIIAKTFFFVFVLLKLISAYNNLHAATVLAGFSDGLLGESRLDNQRHQPENMKTFSTLAA